MHDKAQLVALALQHQCESQARLAEAAGGEENKVQSFFHSCRVPGISIWDYMKRIAKHSGCSPECFLVAFIYLDKYCMLTNNVLTFTNAHRLIITVVLISAKLRDDQFYSNAYFASIGGVGTSELNRLEIEMLKHINWDTWVEPSLYQQYYTALMETYGHLVTDVFVQQ
ncbi:cyclin 2 [Angomonas deanei]|nr:cyclin 2 [Angomonas deanei]|eukprot:EPY40803.1 cyclin 2 [Angomonas deanei]